MDNKIPVLEASARTGSLSQYLDVVRKRWPLAVSIFAAVMICGVLFTLRAQKEYKSVATLMLSSRSPQILSGVQDVMPAEGSGYYFDETFLQTQFRIVGSRSVAQRTAEKLDIVHDDAHNGLGRISNLQDREKARKLFDGASFVQKNANIQTTKRSQIVEIEVINADKEFAAKLANALASSYLEFNMEKRVDSTQDASTWLAAQHEELKHKLDVSENTLYQFMEKNGVLNASLESQMEEVKDRLKEFIITLAKVQSNIIAGKVDAEALKHVQSQPDLIDSLPAIQSSIVVNALKTKLTELKAEQTRLSMKYMPTHPQMQTISEQIGVVEANLKQEIGATIVRLERDGRSLAANESGLKEAITAEREREAAMNHLNLEYGRLKREVETNSKLYELVATRMKEVDLTGMMKANNAQILDKAEVARVPYRPDWKKNLLLAALLGLILSLGTAFLLEAVDTSIRTQKDVADYLGVAFLGVMPMIEIDGKKVDWRKSRRLDVGDLRTRDLYILRHPKSVAAECSKAVRTNLLFMSPDKPHKTVVVTSAMPREGKTTTAVNLAVTMAMAGSRVLIVDTDLRRPRLHRTFSLPNEFGVSSLVVGEATFEQAICKSELENLDVLTCGPIPPNPAELFHTERFREMLESLKQRYDKIIFDAPPIGAVTDPVVLGSLTDATVLVIKSNNTTRQIALHALQTLSDNHVRICGVILNDVDLAARRYGYYYGRYYRYGQYYGRYHGGYEEAAGGGAELGAA